ncbi:MAG: SMC family ATPase [Clostridiaceae bacterium]|nr:SMC family ATPase [Clostridiaceae bacterium]
MRPKLLEIEGLQSFRGRQRIDFSSLGETGLFGIFGPTGSGKSTVLDAITLALYGRVKRAERGTQGIINTNMDSAKVAFTFELQQGNERKTYRVERSFQRKKGTENSSEPKVVRLIEITAAGELPICERTMEVTNRVEALLGLNHDDFTRAVVLPQNSFQEFLLLDNARKREMLERVFYLEEYGRKLLDKISRKMVAMKSQLDILSGHLMEYGDATDEALEVLQNEMKAAASERNQAEKDLKILETRYNEAKEVWQYVHDLELIKSRQQEHAAKADEINRKREQMEKAVKADSLLERVRKTAELELKLTNAGKQLEEILLQLPAVEQDLVRTRQKHDALKAEASVEQPKLVSLKTRLTDALPVQEEILALDKKLTILGNNAIKLTEEMTQKYNEYNTEKVALDELENSMVQLQKEIAMLQVSPAYREQVQHGVILEREAQASSAMSIELEQKITYLQTEIMKLEEELKHSQSMLSIQQKNLDALVEEKQKHEASMPEDRSAIDRFREQMHALENGLEVLKIRNGEVCKTEEKLGEFEISLQNQQTQIISLQQLREEHGIAYEQQKLEVENAEKALSANTVFTLSQNLREGEACPVCGSTHHPAPASGAEPYDIDELEKKVKHAKTVLESRERVLRDTEGKLLIANEQLNALKLQRDQVLADRELKLGQLLQQKEKIAEPYRSMDLEQLQQELDKMNVLYMDKLKALEHWLKKRDEYLVDIQKLHDEMNMGKLSENKLSAELEIKQQTLAQDTESLKAAQLEQEEKQSGYAEFLQSLQIESASTEQKRLTQNDIKIGQLQQRLDQNKILSEKKRAALEQMQLAIQGLKDLLTKNQTETDSLNTQKSEKETKIKELSGALGIEEELRQTELKLAEYDRLAEQYRQALLQAEKQYNELLFQKSTRENQMDIYSDNLEQEEKLLSAALAAKGFQNREEVKLALITQEMQKTVQEEIREYDQKAMNVQAEKEIIQKKLKSRTITEEEWNALDSRYQEAAAWKEACVTRSELAKTSYDQIKAKHERWVALNKKYTALSGQYALYQQIQKLLKAERSKDNSFIDYIAEERLRYVAVKTSEILGVMTKYKYALELDTDAGFIIRDNANGGVYRMVTTLSGGETFLTALSLSLALSDQIQLKGNSPLEFFFLDEGFGTLDNSLLDTVIDSLERLSRKERVIGIISHVPELRNRMARRLIVKPPSAQGEGSLVRLEKA